MILYVWIVPQQKSVCMMLPAAFHSCSYLPKGGTAETWGKNFYFSFKIISVYMFVCVCVCTYEHSCVWMWACAQWAYGGLRTFSADPRLPPHMRQVSLLVFSVAHSSGKLPGIHFSTSHLSVGAWELQILIEIHVQLLMWLLGIWTLVSKCWQVLLSTELFSIALTPIFYNLTQIHDQFLLQHLTNFAWKPWSRLLLF